MCASAWKFAKDEFFSPQLLLLVSGVGWRKSPEENGACSIGVYVSPSTESSAREKRMKLVYVWKWKGCWTVGWEQQLYYFPSRQRRRLERMETFPNREPTVLSQIYTAGYLKLAFEGNKEAGKQLPGLSFLAQGKIERKKALRNNRQQVSAFFLRAPRVELGGWK